MGQKEVFEKIREITIEVASRTGKTIAPDQIQMESRFLEDLGFSSIAILELIMALEEAFDLDEIPESDIDKVRKVEGVVQYLMDASA